MFSDVSSQRTTGSGGRRYRSTSHRGSEVDETLFASKHNHKQQQKSQQTATITEDNKSASQLLETVRSKKANTEKRLPPSAVILTQSELARIKTRSILRSEAELLAEREASDKMLQEKKALAKIRKEKMLRLAEDARKKTKKTDLELENAARDETIRQLAQEKINKELDLVKHLKSLQAKADAFTIRDGQRKQKEEVYAKEKAYNDRMDVLMETERVREIKQREEAEEAKRKQRVLDREVIVQQIRDRQVRKLMDEEAREQEGQAMLALMRGYEEEDRVIAVKKAKEVAAMKIEILAANDKAIADRKALREKDKEEVQAILEYQLKRDAEMRQREEEEEAREQAKKARQAQLLAQQEKSLNNQAELDELRARRAAEEKERAARSREREDAARRKKDLIELKAARVQQASHKKELLAKEAALQQHEWDHAIRYNNAIAQRERELAQHKKTAAQEHLLYLKAQIADLEERRKADRAIKDEEGKKLKQEYALERVKLEAIRDHMIKEMEGKGVKDKYLSEMKRCDIVKLQMR